MRFKTFLQERLADKEIKDIQNVIAGAAEKDITYTEKISDGVVFSITGLGSWVVFKRVFTEAMSVHGWKNESKDGTNLCFKYRKMSLWIKYEQSTARFFLTDKNVDAPHWEETKDDLSDKNDKSSNDSKSVELNSSEG